MANPLADIAADTGLDVTVALQPVPTVAESLQTNSGDSANSIATGDVTADGHVDMIVSNEHSNDLTIYPGFGDGTFGDPNFFALQGANEPIGVVVRDFDNNGLFDIATANAESGDVSLLISSDDGDLGHVRSLSLGQDVKPSSLAAEDLNGDGYVDLAIANDGDDVSILWGLGDGGFSSPTRILVGLVGNPLNYRGPASLKVVDVDADSHLDLVVIRTTFEGELRTDAATLLNDGEGGFLAPRLSFLQADVAITGVAVGDIGGDGLPDIVLGYRSFTLARQTIVSIHEASGDGTFQEPREVSLGFASFLADGDGSLQLGDLDANGWNDVVLYNGRTTLLNDGGSFRAVPGHSVSARVVLVSDVNEDGLPDALGFTHGNAPPSHATVALGNGDGTFTPQGGTLLLRGDSRGAMAFGDLDRDGLIDAVAVGEDGITVRRHAPNGGFLPIEYYPVFARISKFAQAAAIGEVTGDAWPDVVTGGALGNIRVFPGSPGGQLRSPLQLPVEDAKDVKLADINQDGQLDIVVGTSELVSVFRSDGAGGFLPRLDLAAGVAPHEIAVADLDGNGFADVVALNWAEAGGYSVLLGLEDGQWADPEFYPVSGVRFPFTPVLDDFDLDGNLDLLFWSFAVGAGLSRGNGDGTFGPMISVWPGRGHARGVGDLNGDGAPDLVVADESHQFLLINNGEAFFEKADERSLTVSASQTVLADADGDGHLDVFSTSPRKFTLTFGNGNGTLENSLTFPMAQGSQPTAVGIADVNMDDIDDVLIRHHELGSNDLVIAIGRGDGSFVSPVYVPISDVSSPSTEVVADLDGDGQSETLVANRSELTLRSGTGESHDFSIPTEVAVRADLNGDGHVDHVSVDESTNVFSVMLNNGDGGYRDWLFEPTAKGSLPWDSVATDVDNDGQIDIVVGNRRTGDLAFFRRSGETFLPPQYVDLAGGVLSALAAGDFDLDGNVDFVVVLKFGNSYSMQLVYGNGDGTFSDAKSIPVFDRVPDQLSVTDLDSDGQLDLVATAGGGVTVWLGLPGREFAQPTKYHRELGVFAQLNSHLVSDVNSDGAPDVIAIESDTRQLVAYLGNGDGTLSELSDFQIPIGSSLEGLAAGDLNQDGFPDVVTRSGGSNELALLMSNGDGSFQAPRMLATADSLPRAILVADLTEDAINDVLVVHLNRRATMLVGRGDGTFDAPRQLPIEFTSPFVRLHHTVADARLSTFVTESFAHTVQLLTRVGMGEVYFDQGAVVVTNSGSELLQIPTSELKTLTVVGTTYGDEILVSISGTAVSSLVIEAGDGMDTVRWVADDDNSELKGVLYSVETVDFRNSRRELLSLTWLESNQDLYAKIDVGDAFQAEVGWTLQAPGIRNSKFYRVVERAGLRIFVESNAPWQNPIERLDVSGNATVEPFDALHAINALNARSLSTELPDPASVAPTMYRYFDTNGDGFLTSADVLLVVNHLNRSTDLLAAEAEFVMGSPSLNAFRLDCCPSPGATEQGLTTPPNEPGIANVSIPVAIVRKQLLFKGEDANPVLVSRDELKELLDVIARAVEGVAGK